MPLTPRYLPNPHHLALGDRFFDVVRPAEFPKHILRFRNDRWAARVGLDRLSDAEWLAHFAQFEPLPGNLEQPLALRYHGHQFRSYNPNLGDGRGFLFAQMHEDGDPAGRLLDLGTKGSGQTPYSRQGDGRLTLKGAVREVLATEMLEARGVNTSKTFSIVETGESLYRGDEPSPTRSAVLVRLNHSHIRLGSFQRQAALQDPDALRTLLDHVAAVHMPEVDAIPDGLDRVAAFLRQVVANTARTTAQWMAAGFVHGVLNTDNILVTGESFDYGPWRFLPTYDPRFTAAYFDHAGLYAYGRQPETLMWNLTRLAETLLPLCNQDRLVAALDTFPAAFSDALAEAVTRRLGVVRGTVEEDNRLAGALFGFLEDTQIPFDRPFFDWFGGPASAERASASPHAAHYASAAFQPVRDALLARAPRPGVDLGHDYFAGAPSGLLIEEVEALWAPIAAHDDWTAVTAKVAEIRAMGNAVV